MPYHVGSKGSYGCSGYPAVKDDGTVMGCHKTRGAAGSEYSIPASAEEPAILIQLFEMEEGGLEETEYFVGAKASDVMKMPSLESNVGMDKSMQEDEEDEDDMNKEYEGCGCPTCKELNVNCENCPVCREDETMKDCCGEDVSKKAPCWEGYVQRGMKPGKNGRMVPNCVPVEKIWSGSAFDLRKFTK